jgi:hypothetical protein
MQTGSGIRRKTQGAKHQGVYKYLNSAPRHICFVVGVSSQLSNSLTKRENWKAFDLKGYTLW